MRPPEHSPFFGRNPSIAQESFATIQPNRFDALHFEAAHRSIGVI